MFHEVFERYYTYDVEPWIKDQEERSGSITNTDDIRPPVKKPKWIQRALAIPLWILLVGFFLWALIPPVKPPSSFSIDPIFKTVNHPITFTNNTPEFKSYFPGVKQNYIWEINRQQSANTSLTYSFERPGTYLVKLITTRQKLWHKVDSAYSAKIEILEEGIPPNFLFSVSPVNPSVGDTITLTIDETINLSDSILFQWTINSGNNLSGHQITYVCDKPEELEISLSAYFKGDEEDIGCHNKSYKKIYVTPLPDPTLNEEKTSISQVPLIPKYFWQVWVKFAWILLLCLVALIGIFTSWYRRKILLPRKLEEQFKVGDHPPYTLPIPIQVNAIVPETEIYALADSLRQRRKGNAHTLNLSASITASIQGGGFPHLIYDKGSSATEYLVLIEQKYEQDHQARLWGMLMNILKEEDVSIETFYFEGDPRFCFPNSDIDDELISYSLDQLYQRFGNHRLLIFANPEIVLHQRKATLSLWADEELLRWEDKVWFTPNIPAKWGYSEKLISNYFILLSSDLSSQLHLVELLSGEKESDYYQLKSELSFPKEQNFIEQDLFTVNGLKDYLGDQQFQWIAATAVHPEPNWEITLTIGKALKDSINLPVFKEQLKLDYKSLRKISMIPWLQNGNIGDDLIKGLIDSLDPEIELVARNAVLNVIKEAVVTPEGYAFREKEIQIAMHQAHLFPNDREVQDKLVYLYDQGLLSYPYQIDPLSDQFNSTKRLSFIAVLSLLVTVAGFFYFSQPTKVSTPFLTYSSFSEANDTLALDQLDPLLSDSSNIIFDRNNLRIGKISSRFAHLKMEIFTQREGFKLPLDDKSRVIVSMSDRHLANYQKLSITSVTAINESDLQLLPMKALFLLDLNGNKQDSVESRRRKFENAKNTIQQVLTSGNFDNANVEFAWFKDEVSESMPLTLANFDSVFEIVDEQANKSSTSNSINNALKLKIEELINFQGQKVLIILSEGQNGFSNIPPSEGEKVISRSEIYDLITISDSTLLIFPVATGVNPDESFLRELALLTKSNIDYYSTSLIPQEFGSTFKTPISNFQPNWRLLVKPPKGDSIWGLEKRKFKITYFDSKTGIKIEDIRSTSIGSATGYIELQRESNLDLIIVGIIGLGIGIILILIPILIIFIFNRLGFKKHSQNSFENSDKGFFDHIISSKGLTWLGIGALGGWFARFSIEVIKIEEFSDLRDLLTVFDTHYNQMSNAIFFELTAGSILGLATLGTLAFLQEFSRGRQFSSNRIFTKLLLGILTGFILFFLKGTFVAYFIISSYWGQFLAWTIFGTVIGYLSTLFTRILPIRSIIGGLITSIIAYNTFFFLNLPMISDIVGKGVANVLSFMGYGGMFSIAMYFLVFQFNYFRSEVKPESQEKEPMLT